MYGSKPARTPAAADLGYERASHPKLLRERQLRAGAQLALPRFGHSAPGWSQDLRAYQS
ncbi:hypothetical protein [Streptomyces sp. BE230]|uniref:hypothetical protein n=1 Tax=Streptomyces sp. BE230 TaxID=3002526 RepID=UPI002ED3E87C|nr:hypothetical protein [Streptomyces sp. BE230]